MTTVAPVLETQDLNVTFKVRAAGGSRKRHELRAVRDVNLVVHAGQTLGLVGESGSGKSSTARAICGLSPYEGKVLFSKQDAREFSDIRAVARHRQMVFQDPYSSLDPLMTVGESIAEPLRILEGRKRTHAARVEQLLNLVQLPARYAYRLPSELSGGQRQRVAIARALAVEPSLVVCDEALSALDASTQGEILEIFRELKETGGVSFLFIAHDLAVVRHLADVVAVMYLGSIVEVGPAEDIFRAPRHPYTQSLLAAAPIPHPRLQRARRAPAVKGETPDPSNPPSGCVFHPRCPLAIDKCATEVPRLLSIGSREISCHVNGAGAAVPAVADANPHPVSGRSLRTTGQAPPYSQDSVAEHLAEIYRHDYTDECQRKRSRPRDPPPLTCGCRRQTFTATGEERG
jgi:oligopeptide/dipeptide ABC transporter ATP-binding protein